MIIRYAGPTNPKDGGKTFNLSFNRKYRVFRFFPNIGVARILDDSGTVVNVGRKFWEVVKE